MAYILKTAQSAFVIFIALLGMRNGTDALSISINPEKSIAAVENSIFISCVAGSGDEMKKEIALLEISKNNGQLLAALRPCSNITYGSDVTDRILVNGHIDDDVSKSYLNVTLTAPVSQDTGVYTCSMHYLEKAVLKEDRESRNLLVENLNVSSLEAALNSLKERLTIVEVGGRMNTENIKNLQKNATYTSAFSVTATPGIHMYPAVGKPVVFPNVIMREGDGYDVKTGLFTAPRAGLYYFNVLALTGTGLRLDLDLKANEKILARMYLTGKSAGDQSSISTVTPLSVGDVVKVVPETVIRGSYIHTNIYSLFTGYFIKPLP